MSKSAIVKGIALFLGLCIIGCTLCIILKLAQIYNQSKGLPQDNKIINITVSEDSVIDDMQVNNGKIYLLIKSSNKQQVMIYDEKTQEKTILNFNKGEK